MSIRDRKVRRDSFSASLQIEPATVRPASMLEVYANQHRGDFTVFRSERDKAIRTETQYEKRKRK